MLTTEKFLGCCRLETGGLIIGWINAVSDVIIMVILSLCLLFMAIFDCQDFKRILIEKGHRVTQDAMDFCAGSKIVIAVVLVIIILIVAGFLSIAVCLIRGTNARDHVRVRPMMILMGITTVLSFLNILSFTAQGVVQGLLYGLVYGYLFVVLYSLYSMFKQEYERGFSAQYQAPPGAKV